MIHYERYFAFFLTVNFSSVICPRNVRFIAYQQYHFKIFVSLLQAFYLNTFYLLDLKLTGCHEAENILLLFLRLGLIDYTCLIPLLDDRQSLLH